MSTPPPYSPSDLAEARELLAKLDADVLNDERDITGTIAAALAERERRVWMQVLQLILDHTPSDRRALSAIGKAAQEAVKP